MNKSKTYIYVITSTHMKSNHYKIGKHKGTKEQLYNRYRTYIINPDILRFIDVGHKDYSQCEKDIFKQINKYRITRKGFNGKGQLTEWVKMDKSKLLKIVDIYFNQYTPTNYEVVVSWFTWAKSIIS